MSHTNADVDRAVKALRKPDGGLSEARAVVQLGEETVPALLEATGDSEPRVRGLACFALGELGTASVPVMHALRVRLDDEDPEVRFSAARAVGMLRVAPDEVVTRLEVMVETDPHPTARSGAEAALLELGRPPSSDARRIEELLKAVEDADPLTREATIDSLGRLSFEGIDAATQERILRVLVDRLRRDDYFQSRASAALAMKKMGQTPPFVVAALTDALEDPHPLVRSMAEQVLKTRP